MRLILGVLLMMAFASLVRAQSEVPLPGGGGITAFKTFWLQKREGCQPMVSFTIKNISADDIGTLTFRFEVVDKDAGAIFATGQTSVPGSALPPGGATDVVIGGDHDISAHACLGDMHEGAFSGIHFAVRLSATGGGEPSTLVRDEIMSETLSAAQD